QVAVRVEPDEPEPAVARSEALDGADVRAAAAAQDERALGELARDREVLLAERVLLDHRDLGIRQRQPRRFGHRLTVLSPGLRDADESGRELATAGVTLVGGTEGDRRVGVAVGALGSEA